MNKNLRFRPIAAGMILVFVAIMSTSITASAQSYTSDQWWVFFTEKDTLTPLPQDYLHPNAMARRIKHNYPLVSIEDYPVNPLYLEQVNHLADSSGVVSRWFNAVFVYAGTEAVKKIFALDFVSHVAPAAPGLPLAKADQAELMDESLSGPDLLFTQLRHMRGEHFQQAGIDGSGVTIAVFDGGFKGVMEHLAFQHIVNDGRIMATWDFHLDKPNVFDYHTHGTNVLSTVGGISSMGPMGHATGANFLLARTEIRREVFFEEQYWLAAAEWAERYGADIINSSLGYTYHRYFPEQMDGQTTLIARAAQKAHEMGVLVVNAAGNDGENELWKVIASPADSPDVLTVGALNPANMLRAPFSSIGPTADNRLKPEVTAQGTVWAATTNGMSTPSGTSFSSPLVAGFAACILQMHPDWTNDQVKEAVIKSASLYPYYDYVHGHGIPQASYFFTPESGKKTATFKIIQTANELSINIPAPYLYDFGNGWFERYFYYHIKDAAGRITHYYVLDALENEVLTLDTSNYNSGQQLHFYYRGFSRMVNF